MDELIFSFLKIIFFVGLYKKYGLIKAFLIYCAFLMTAILIGIYTSELKMIASQFITIFNPKDT